MKLRVRFAETDQMGIAHHSAYLIWFEAARVEWLRERGMSYRSLEDDGVSLAVSAIRVDYRRSARFDDEICVETDLVELRSRRVRFHYRLYAPPGGGLLATGSSLHTPTDSSGRAVRLPAVWLRALAPHLTDEHRADEHRPAAHLEAGSDRAD